MNRYLILLVFSFSFLLSCRPSYVESQLLDIENYIMDRPDSALTVLESMDRSLLDKEEYRAHHALLHAMALDKNFVNVDDDSLAQVAVLFRLVLTFLPRSKRLLISWLQSPSAVILEPKK